jgi:hypothetical protein
MLGESICAVTYTHYTETTDSQKEQIKTNFYSYLNNENVIIFADVIEEIEIQFPTSPLATLLKQYGYRPTPVKSPITEAADTLNQHEKVTIIKFSEFGFPVIRNTVINKAEVKPYAQYNESLQLVHRPKRKRTSYRMTILPYEDVIIYKGWLDLDLEKLTYNIEEGKDVTVKQSKYCSFDNKFLNDVMKNIKAEPIVKIIK